MEFPVIAPTPAKAPTWRDLCKTEHRLLDVEQKALALHDAGRDDLRAQSEVKQAFMPLIGWSAEKYDLRHSAAYDAGYDHLLACWETGSRP